MAYERVLDPIVLGGRTVKNRVVVTSHTAFADHRDPHDGGSQYAAYVAERAQGGAGLIVVQNLRVHRSSDPVRRLAPRQDVVDKLRALSSRVEAFDTTLLLQLLHHGAHGLSDSRDDLHPLWSFNGAVSPEGEASHRMNDAEIREVIDGYADAAALAEQAGLHGVELHAAHGYLLHQSFAPWGNDRTDEWSGPGFAVAVIEAVRRATRPGFIVGLRVSIDDWREEPSLGIDGSLAMIRSIVDAAPVDVVNHSEGSSKAHYHRAIGTYRHPEGEFLPLTGRLRNALPPTVPLIGVGRILSLATAEQALADGRCDLVGLTRAHIADPHLVAKSTVSGLDPVRPCVGANTCIDRVLAGHEMRCWHNPRVGHELLELEPAKAARHVVVVGGGCAGLTVAHVAAGRGHRVTLLEKDSELGGRLNLVRGWTGPQSLLESIDWIRSTEAFARVDVRTDCEVDERVLRNLKPDVVVLATGASFVASTPADNDGSVPVVTVEEAAVLLRESPRELGGRHVLVDDAAGSYDASLLTEALAVAGIVATYSTPLPTLGARMGYTQQVEMRERLAVLGVRVLTTRSIAQVRAGVVTLAEAGALSKSSVQADLIVSARQGTSRIDLASVAERVCDDVQAVGDAAAPRTAFQAFADADRVARLL